MPRVHVEPFDGEASPAAVAAGLAGRPGLAWLDADGESERGRYAFVGSDPLEVRRSVFADGRPFEPFDGLGGHRPARDGRPRVEGPPEARVPRWAGYLAYDAVWAGRATGRRRPRLPRDPAAPVGWLGRYEAWVAFDRIAGKTWCVGDDAEACARLRSRIGQGATPRATVGTPVSEPPEAHLHAVRAALAQIGAGNVYQVNLARRWEAPFEGAPLGLALAMGTASPVPLGLFLDAGDHAVVARTMETFLEWDGPGTGLATRPIKGTIARRGEDALEASALRSDDKERAEHAMIVDLMRNDLGRVARPGTVRVAEVMAVEPYARLSHLVSTVVCSPRPGATVRSVLEATFPPGSVTGTPKLSAVELIERLESSPRGAYCGVVGHVSRTGGMRWAVAIRTAQVNDGRVRYHAGGGIVEASNPERELAETELKARVFLDAVSTLG